MHVTRLDTSKCACSNQRLYRTVFHSLLRFRVDADFWKSEKSVRFQANTDTLQSNKWAQSEKKNGVIRSWGLLLYLAFCVYLVGKIVL